MGKLYIISEDNYMEILERLQKICNRFKLMEKYTCYETPCRTKKENHKNVIYESKSWGTRLNYNYDYDSIEEKYCNTMFIHVTKHPFRTEFENNPNSVDGKMYTDTKPLIHLNTGAAAAIVLGVNDKIKFQKWGFITYTDNSYTRFSNPLNVYKNAFIINRTCKIVNLEAEISIRNEEYRLYCLTEDEMMMEILEEE